MVLCMTTINIKAVFSFRDEHLIFSIGGSLVLAEGGICVVGNLSSQKKEVRDSLQKSDHKPLATENALHETL